MSGKRPAKRASNPLSRKLRKADMVSYLTSTGSIRPHVASSLYDGGLDRWSKLIDRTGPELMDYKGVGPKTAEALMALGEIKKVELLSVNGELDTRKALQGMSELRGREIDELMREGYNSMERLARAHTGQLLEVKGLKRKTAEEIIDMARTAIAPGPVVIEVPEQERPQVQPVVQAPAPPPQLQVREGETLQESAPEGPPAELPKESIEEATALSAEEAPKEPPKESSAKQEGFFSKFMGGIKGLFSAKKEQPAPAPAPAGEQPKPPEEAHPSSEAPQEQPSAEVKVEEGQPPVEGAAPEAATQAPPIMEEAGTEKGEGQPEVAPPVPGIEPSSEEKPPEAAAAPAEAAGSPPAEPRPSFFQRMKEKLLGGKKAAPEQAEEQPAPAAPAEAPAAAGEAGTEEQKLAEAAPEGKEPEEKAAIERFEDIPGVTPEVATKLYGSGYLNVSELKEAIPDDLMMIDGIDRETAERIYLALR